MKAQRLIPLAAIAAMLCLPSAQAWAQKEDSEKAKTVTGCLEKGDQANEFKITDNGATYNLTPSGSVNMAEHIGHKVTVTGKNTREQAGGTPAGDKHAGERIEVTNVKMVSTTCP